MQNHTGRYNTIEYQQDHVGPYLTLQDQMRPYRTIRDHMGQYGTIRDRQYHKGPYRIIQDHSQLFQASRRACTPKKKRKKRIKKNKKKKIISFLVATNVVSCWPPERRPTGTLTARAKNAEKLQFLNPEIVNMVQNISGSRNCQNGEITGSRNRRNGRQILYINRKKSLF